MNRTIQNADLSNSITDADEIETKLDEADRAAQLDDTRYTEDEVFERIKSRF